MENNCNIDNNWSQFHNQNANQKQYQLTIVVKQVRNRLTKKVQENKCFSIKFGTNAFMHKKILENIQHTFPQNNNSLQQKQKDYKCLIKIYDVEENGNKTINCVGAVSLFPYFCGRKFVNVQIVENIGHLVVHMLITIEPSPINQQIDLNLNVEQEQQLEIEIESNQFQQQTRQQFKNPLLMQQIVNLAQSIDLRNQIIREDKPQQDNLITKSTNNKQLLINFQNSKKLKQQSKVPLLNNNLSSSLSEQSFEINEKENILSNSIKVSNNNQLKKDSLQKSKSLLLLDYYKEQIDCLGEQLIEERRKYKKLQEKLSKYCLKNHTMEEQINNMQIVFEEFKKISHNFIHFIKKDSNAKYRIEIDQKQEKIIVPILFNQQSYNVIHNFFDFLTKIQQNAINDLQKQKTNKKIRKISLQHNLQQNFNQKSNRKYNNLIEQQIKNLKQQLQRKCLLVHELKNKESQMNKKQENLNQIIKNKNDLLNGFKKTLTSNNEEMDEIENELLHQAKINKNLQLIINELKEEIEIRDELIEEFVQNNQHIFGKKQLCQHIKDCETWVNFEKQHRKWDINEDKILNIDRNLINFIKCPQIHKAFTQPQLQSIHKHLNTLTKQIQNLQNSQIPQK